MKRGKLIVIDGTDGSGKATQTRLLVSHLKKAGKKVAAISFPQHGSKSAGLTENYLNGKYGPADRVDPYIASIFYAIDRYDASFKIRGWLEKGKIVIADRYTTANIGHQAGKIKNLKVRKNFIKWLFELEYNLLKIPQPDINIILHMPLAVTKNLLKKNQPKKYVKGKKLDIHERNLKHLKNASASYLLAAKTLKNFRLIDCSIRDNKGIQTRKEIHSKIWQVVKKII